MKTGVLNAYLSSTGAAAHARVTGYPPPSRSSSRWGPVGGLSRTPATLSHARTRAHAPGLPGERPSACDLTIV